jgi:chromosome partitioning protein
MTPVVSFLNMKGGVGKSTLCYNIAYTLARHFNKRVLVIDMDPQFNTTQALIEKYYDSDFYLHLVKEKKTILRVFQNTTSIIQRYTNTTNEELSEQIILNLEENLSLICGTLDLIMVESSQRGTENLLYSFIDGIISKNEFNYILIDCPPTHSFYTTSSLIASNFYLAPVKPDMYSLLGVELLQSVVDNVNTLHKSNTKCLGIIFTMVKGLQTQEKIIASVKEKYNTIKVFKNVMNNFQYNETGRIDTFMFDMLRTRNEIIAITSEFVKELEENEKNV